MSNFGDRWKGVGFALLAAVLFGVSTPLAKSVSPHVEPVLLAGLLYLGSGIGLGAYTFLRVARKQAGQHEAALKRADAPWLAPHVLREHPPGIIAFAIASSEPPIPRFGCTVSFLTGAAA